MGKTGLIDEADLADIDPCPGCGTPVRRFGNVAIGGTNRDPIRSGPWWCPACLQARTVRAAAGIRPTGETGQGALL